VEPSNAGEYITAVTKASPPVAVTGISLAGVSLNEWVLIATLLYTILQISFLLYGKLIKKDT
jgi:hypothetical protein